ncbi:hypothetical protein SLEP1_g298 [Rubroshorea leprosula]|uniref:C2 domain-containing protein n=1 Tax=Rubroshorea leprosula TaxID=152421 RepID=A0AAV5HJ06_9ROSI|nr:hypothetical protein SLEP1_g298 [Rubroshorea leprosula]
MSLLQTPFQLLEVNIISAQDLEPVCRKMRTYAVAWVHPERKLTSRVDTMGHTNPTWNDKFVFRVNDSFLYGDTSAVMIEIYALHWFRDIHVGTVRVIVGNLIPPSERPSNNHYVQVGMRFVALQVRRQSGRPQGILNIGVAVLDSSKRSMPLYMHMGSSAVGYKHLMGEEDITTTNGSAANHQQRIVKPELRRTKSDSSSIIGVEAIVRKKRASVVNGSNLDGSMINGGSMVHGVEPKRKGGSMVNGFDPRPKGGSMVNGFEPRPKGGSMVNGGCITTGKESEKKKVNPRGSSMVNESEMAKLKGKKGKSGSIVNGLEARDSGKKQGSWVTQSEVVDPPKKNGSLVNGVQDSDYKKAGKTASKSPPTKSPVKSFGLDHGSQDKFPKYNGYEFGVTKRPGAFWTDSELGPSPSEVAANVAKNMYQRMDDAESSILGWSLDGSVEGLESKLDRWRSEMPTLYDYGEYSSLESSVLPAPKKKTHNRRHTDSGGLFSCFSNICGCQCSIVIGGSPPAQAGQKKSNKFRRTPSSFDSMSFR